MQESPILVESIQAAAALPAHRFVSHAHGLPAAGANTLGVTRSSALVGEDCPVTVIGTAIIEVAGPLAKYALVESTATGTATALDEGIAAGRLLQAATGAGQKVEILLFPN